MERLPLSNPEGSLTAAQHFEPGDFTFRNRFGRAASQEVGCGEEREAQPNESIIDHTKQSWYSSNATSALTLAAELNRSLYKQIFLERFSQVLPQLNHFRYGSENIIQYHHVYLLIIIMNSFTLSNLLIKKLVKAHRTRISTDTE
ncbi:Hypothetical_protein [Hexamita inflata]|uniref:Hypothetical_protein n=1 Tax=Hexamita inflata TaxID=28002 RepID=A0AA86QZ02_9EUKA|nr:Hypothetical protein HINF_LOCUS51491 [Hexamita inflata]